MSTVIFIDPNQWVIMKGSLPLTRNVAWDQAKERLRQGEPGLSLFHNAVGVQVSKKDALSFRGTPNIIKVPLCPTCKAETIKRNGQYGLYFGCSKYPKCNGTISASKCMANDRDEDQRV